MVQNPHAFLHKTRNTLLHSKWEENPESYSGFSSTLIPRCFMKIARSKISYRWLSASYICATSLAEINRVLYTRRLSIMKERPIALLREPPKTNLIPAP